MLYLGGSSEHGRTQTKIVVLNSFSRFKEPIEFSACIGRVTSVAIDLGLVSVKQFIGNNGHKVTKRWFGKLGNRESETTSYVYAQRE